MVYVGLDVSSKSFVVHVIDEKKRVVKRGAIAPTRTALRDLCAELGGTRKLIVFEAGNQMKWIAETLQRQPGVNLHVVHPNEVKWIAASGGKKTDKVDAKKLAELARGDLLPRRVHLVEGVTREMRELVSARTRLMQQRVRLINTLRGYLKQEGVQVGEKFLARDDWRAALARRHVSAPLQEIVAAFRPSLAALRAGESALVRRLRQLSDDRTRLLESIPSIGLLSARTVVSALDDAHRFDNRKCVAKYGALTPTIYQSGDVVQQGHINRNGRQEIRRVLLQAAHLVVRMKSPASAPLRRFFLRLEQKRGKKKALIALARKLLVICYGVLKSGQPFDPQKLEGRPRSGPPAPRRRRTATLRTAAA